jgi:hypothetical protein
MMFDPPATAAGAGYLTLKVARLKIIRRMAMI